MHLSHPRLHHPHLRYLFLETEYKDTAFLWQPYSKHTKASSLQGHRFVILLLGSRGARIQLSLIAFAFRSFASYALLLPTSQVLSSLFFAADLR